MGYILFLLLIAFAFFLLPLANFSFFLDLTDIFVLFLLFSTYFY